MSVLLPQTRPLFPETGPLFLETRLLKFQIVFGFEVGYEDVYEDGHEEGDENKQSKNHELESFVVSADKVSEQRYEGVHCSMQRNADDSKTEDEHAKAETNYAKAQFENAKTEVNECVKSTAKDHFDDSESRIACNDRVRLSDGLRPRLD